MKRPHHIAKIRPGERVDSRCGVALVELITALAVLIVGLLGAVHLYYRGLDALHAVRESSLVATAIRNEVEALRAAPFASLKSGPDVQLQCKEPGLDQLVNLRMTVRIDDAFDTNLRIKWISVDATWSGEHGRIMRRNATTLIADKEAS
jgi:Tfp pilus assembly protein PilV